MNSPHTPSTSNQQPSERQRDSFTVSRRRLLASSATGLASLTALGTAGRAAAATGEHTLVIHGYFKRPTSYSFTVESNLQHSTANGATIDDGQDTIVGQSAHGTVTTGKDAYTFDGALHSFRTTGSDQFQVFLDGEPAHVGRRPDNLLLIEGTGTNTPYTFSAENFLKKSTAYGAAKDSSDRIVRQSAHGAVGSETDAYTFDGELHSFNFDESGAVNVTLNGRPAHVGRASLRDHELLIRGTGPKTEYTFLTSGDVVKNDAYGATINTSDHRRGRIVNGVVSNGKDSYGFNGDIRSFNFDQSGAIQVLLDGESAHVGQIPDHLLRVFPSSDGGGTYEFSVSDALYKVDGIEEDDTVNGTSASGSVSYENFNSDTYGYDGEITSLSVNGNPLTVYNDGVEIDPSDYQ